MKQKLVRDLEHGEGGFIWPAAIDPIRGTVNQYAPVFDDTAHEARMATIWASDGANHSSRFKILVPAGVEADAFARMVPATIVRGESLGTGDDPFDICIAEAVESVQADFARRDAEAAA